MVRLKGSSVTSKVPPSSNETIPSADVRATIDRFTERASLSGQPVLNTADKNMYWFVFRNWQMKKGREHDYNLENVYKTKKENSFVIYPWKKGNAVVTPNTGGSWDYLQLARTVSPY